MDPCLPRAPFAAVAALATLLLAPSFAHADAEDERVPFSTFAERLQRETCGALYGDVTQGAGALCLQQDVLAAYRTDQDEHCADVALCDAEGGVLVSRIPTCTEAMVHYLSTSTQYDVDGNVAALLEAYAAVSARCWGQWLCVE